MSLASELHSILARFRGRIAEQVNSGQVLTIDRHLDQLAAVAEADIQTADTVGHTVLGELYTALHNTTSGAPAPTADTPPAPPAPAPAPVSPAPAVPTTTAPEQAAGAGKPAGGTAG